MLQEWRRKANLMKEKKETFRFSPKNADMVCNRKQQDTALEKTIRS